MTSQTDKHQRSKDMTRRPNGLNYIYKYFDVIRGSFNGSLTFRWQDNVYKTIINQAGEPPTIDAHLRQLLLIWNIIIGNITFLPFYKDSSFDFDWKLGNRVSGHYVFITLLLFLSKSKNDLLNPINNLLVLHH